MTTSRRVDLDGRATEAEREVTEYLEGATPDAHRLFRTPRNWVFDVRKYWLSQEVEPSLENWWLDRTEEQLAIALNAFRTLRAQVDKVGGLKKFKTFGG